MLPRLVGLYDMMRLRPEIFLQLARITGMIREGLAWSEIYAHLPKRLSDPAADKPRSSSHLLRAHPDQELADAYQAIASECKELGLDAAAATAKRISQMAAEGGTLADRYALQRDFDDRLLDQLSSRMCWLIEPDRTRFFTDANLFGPKVAEAFPSAILDIEEAGKCLALDRGTACVFHLMRVMEVALKSLAHALGIPYSPGWESYLKQINKQIGLDWKDKEPEWKQDEAFYAAVSGDLLIVKNAWRNPTMHVRINYDPEKALDVFNGVRTFMQHLSTKLKEPTA